MATKRFVVRDEASGEDVAIEASGLDDAVEQYVREHADDRWSDHFSVLAREESSVRWLTFNVMTRTEFIVEVGNPTPGPVVAREPADDHDGAAR